MILKNPAPSRKKAQFKPFFKYYIKLIYQYKKRGRLFYILAGKLGKFSYCRSRENGIKITIFTAITYVLQVLYEKSFLEIFLNTLHIFTLKNLSVFYDASFLIFILLSNISHFL